MADEQIKIRIQADAEQFKVVSAAVEKALAGIGKQADITNSKIKSLDSTVKKTNMQWTNLALVIQDIPFGFRGIQNNLPALVGGFAAATGPIYLGISAVIAALTIWDQKTSAAASSAKKLKDEQKSLSDQLLESSQSARTQGLLLQGYVEIARNINLAETTRIEALKKANEIYGRHNEKLTLTNINTQKVKESLDGYIQSLIQFAVAEKYAAQIADKIIERDKVQAQIDKKKKESYAYLLEYTGKQTLASRDVVDVMADRRRAEGEVYKLIEDKKSIIQEITDLTNNYKTSLTEATKASALFGRIEEPKKGTKDKSQKRIDDELERQKKATLYLQQWESKFLADSQKALDDADKDKRKEEVDSYKQRVIDFKTFYGNKLQLAEGDRQEQKIILEQQMQDLIYFYQTFGMYAGDVGDIFSDVYKKWVDNNKAITDEATKSIINMGVGIMNALGPALDMLLEKGASIGEVLSTAFTDIIKKLIKVAIAAAVAVAIISLLPGMQGKIAEAGGKLAYFGKLVGTGMGIPNLFNSSAGSTATNTAQGVSNGLNASNGINVNVVGKIAGGDILLASQQAQRNNESTF